MQQRWGGIDISGRQRYAFNGAIVGFIAAIFGLYDLAMLVLFPIIGAFMGMARWDSNEKKRIEYERLVSKHEER